MSIHGSQEPPLNHHNLHSPLFSHPISKELCIPNPSIFIASGLFIEPTIPSSLSDFISLKCSSTGVSSSVSWFKPARLRKERREKGVSGFVSSGGGFLSLSLRKGKSETEGVNGGQQVKTLRIRGGAAVNTTKHLWAGAVAAMVSRTLVAPLERLKLEYILRGETKNLFELIKTIAVTQGLRGFWKGNLLNIFRTAPFKSINFCAYDTYRKQLRRLTQNEETTHFERFIAGAAAGITATSLCIPLDTIRTKLVAPGGEALGGFIGAFSHMIQTEGFFSLYKGLVPSILSMAPAGAVFYGVYDMLKSSYLRSPEGRKRIQNMNRQDNELNALAQLELSPVRTLLYGAIAGACTEAATYPFEVLRRKLQMQVKATKLGTFATFLKVVEQGGVSALYAGLIPSLLQVLPSAAISFFVYEFMKIVLKVE